MSETEDNTVVTKDLSRDPSGVETTSNSSHGTKDLSDMETAIKSYHGKVEMNEGEEKMATVPKSTFICVCVASALAIIAASSVAITYSVLLRAEKQGSFGLKVCLDAEIRVSFAVVRSFLS